MLGVPFDVMEALDGVVITDEVPAALNTAQQREATSSALVDALVDLHGVDVSTGELAAFGRPDGYLRPTGQRFTSLWQINSTRNPLGGPQALAAMKTRLTSRALEMFLPLALHQLMAARDRPVDLARPDT